MINAINQINIAVSSGGKHGRVPVGATTISVASWIPRFIGFCFYNSPRDAPRDSPRKTIVWVKLTNDRTS
jgi:hypothetical protein